MGQAITRLKISGQNCTANCKTAVGRAGELQDVWSIQLVLIRVVVLRPRRRYGHGTVEAVIDHSWRRS